MKLSPEQLAVIRQRIHKSDITIKTLEDDLLDHLCCVVEKKMDKGNHFDTALEEALSELAPYGLDAIQLQTFYLLRSPKIIFMKKVMYLIGLITAGAVSLGWLFTVLRWPGGYELFNYGFLGFLLLFIPLFVIDRYKITLKKALSEKLKILMGSVSGIIVGISLVFKFLHLQGADMVLVVGMLMFTFGFLPFLFFSMYKKAVS
ncbi:MAG TPA: hypothetical protein VJ184_07710 [Chryseolinea sp.]|nr:hypothetical protein [Chryseolinea sp.]